MNIFIITFNTILLVLAIIYPSYNLYIILEQLTIVLLYILYKIHNRRKMLAQEMILKNEIPNGFIPLVAGCLEKQRSCCYQDIIATIIDLIKRHYFHLEITDHYGKRQIIIKQNISKNIDELDIIEQSILHFILKGEEKIDLMQYVNKLHHDTNEVIRVKSLLSNISNRIAVKYYSSNAIIYITLIFSVVEFYLFSMVSGNSIIMIPIFSLILIIIWFISFQAEILTTLKTKYLKLRGELNGFKTYLIANTKLDNFDMKYFPYLITFDITEKINLNTLKDKEKLITVYQILNEMFDQVEPKENIH